MSNFQSLERAIDILFAFNKEELYLTAEEIAKKVGLPRVSVYRYLNTLVDRGLLEKDDDSLKFRLGYKLLYFQSLIHYNDVLEKVALPVMTQISKNIKETIHLTIFKNGQGTIIESIESSASVRVAPPLGTPLPVNGGSTLEAIIAFLPANEIDELCNQEFIEFTKNTIMTKPALINKLEKVRQDGYAYSYEEVHDGAWGVAAPIFNRNGRPIASLGISGPIFRLSDSLKELAIEHVLKSSNEITEKFLHNNTSHF